MGFNGQRVLALESRRAKEMAQLIRMNGGEPFVAPSMVEAPVEQNEEAWRFAERLFAGEFEMMILLTGVGTRLLNRLLSTRYGEERFPAALRGLTTVVRGPKPAAVLREWGVPVALFAREPNTWREVLEATEGRPERRIAVQEYGRTNEELLDGLRARGCEVTTVRSYGWELPEDTGPLREAVQRLSRSEFDSVLFTTGVQVQHLLRVAAEEGREEDVRRGLARAKVGSIGPTCSEALEENGIRNDFEPSHPKMGVLVQEAASRFGD